MGIVTVSRVNYVKKTLVRIGWIEERKRKDRGGNLLGLLRIARRIYGTGAEDAFHIVVDGRKAFSRGDELRGPVESIRSATG